jgi:NAD(P)-dependent dehydrogenase (short-subunit alcohol dehydrogenase family)
MNEGSPVHFVIGAAGGIGTALCRALVARGDGVVLAGRTRETLDALGASLSAPVHVLDATVPAEVEACVKAAAEEHGRVDGIVNLAGSILLKPAHITSDEEWAETLAQNLTSAFGAVRAAAKTMRKNGGSVVLMSTAAARVGLTNHEAIAAAKAGVEGLARSAAATYAPRGIRVNVVAPGLVVTPMSERIVANEASRKASEGMHPLGRLGEPEDVASAIAWLLDPAQSWVTGQVLGVDGGLGAVRPR